MPTTFDRFSDLPIELQSNVIQHAWDDALPDRPNTLVIAFDDATGPRIKAVGPHSLMQVNTVFRQEVLRRAKGEIIHAFRRTSEPTGWSDAVYFDPDTDILELDLQQDTERQIATSLQKLSTTFANQVHDVRLVFSESAYRRLERGLNRRSTGKVMHAVARCFPSPQMVEIMVMPDTPPSQWETKIDCFNRYRMRFPLISFVWSGLRGIIEPDSRRYLPVVLATERDEWPGTTSDITYRFWS